MTPTVLHHDEALLVATKPAGMLSQADRTGDVDLLNWSRRWIVTHTETQQTDPFVGLVHRLDRPTSGVMVVARTSAAARILSQQFRERTVEKRYLAVVEGPLRGIGTWRDTIAKIDQQPRRVSSNHPKGKHAELTWQALGSADGRTLLHIQLQTGRPHQIRLQASVRGHPVVGDTRYGATAALDRTIALHHALLRFEHPTTHRMQAFTAATPDAWDAVLPTALQKTMDRFVLH